jgi:hypothetical protein
MFDFLFAGTFCYYLQPIAVDHGNIRTPAAKYG